MRIAWMIGSMWGHARWIWNQRSETEDLVQRVFDAKVKPAMDSAYDSGFAAGIHWTLNELLAVPIIEDMPELRRWLMDARAHASEHYDLDRP